MQYDQSCLDRKEYFPELVKIDKESLIRQTFDSSVAGSSSVTSLRGELKLCERAQERIKDKEKLDHCKLVIETRKAVADQEEKIKRLKKEKAPKDLIDIERAIRTKLYDDLRIYTTRYCGNCPYNKGNTHHRLNYARYGTRKETLANTKVFIAINMIASSSVRDGEELLEPSYVSIRKLANICNLYRNTALKALKYWEEQGIIDFAPVGKGKYAISLTKSYTDKRGLRANEGGAGFITLPFSIVNLIMQIDNIDLLRLLILTLLCVDDGLHNLSFYEVGEEKFNIKTSGSLLKYVVRHQHASMSDLIDRFNTKVNRLLKQGQTIILHARANDYTFYSDERFSNVDITISKTLCPRQKTMPPEFYDLTRKLTPEAVEQIEAAKKIMFGDQKKLQDLLLCKPDGSGFVRPDTKLMPNTGQESLVPALEAIQNNFGTDYIKEALVQTYRHKREKMLMLFTGIKPGEKGFGETVQELSAYMQSIARRLKNQFLLTRDPFPEPAF